MCGYWVGTDSGIDSIMLLFAGNNKDGSFQINVKKTATVMFVHVLDW